MISDKSCSVLVHMIKTKMSLLKHKISDPENGRWQHHDSDLIEKVRMVRQWSHAIHIYFILNI